MRDETWDQMVAKSFTPRQFFGDDVGEQTEDKVMWVYRKTETNIWTVGYWTPDGQWEMDSDHGDKEEAAKRVHWLNGGNS